MAALAAAGADPRLAMGYDLTDWQLQLSGDDQVLETLNGSGELAPVYTLALEDIGLGGLVRPGR